MKTQINFLAAALLLLAGCKNSDREPASQRSEPQTVTYHESAAVDTMTSEPETVDENNTVAGQSQSTKIVQTTHKYLKRKAQPKKLTQYQIDSIKTERGAIVTPLENVGASLTPGSGMAVPSNTKVGPGTTATMGSSTGD